ncbi:hypothetical protein B0181_11620 [Moraxella caviae]|uniref:Uncharacterized protein n=1 Tax=Moraxella caviae TaxID=34060 RepID=A0A1S9ZT96_9GAMM|nr:hypothetical protein [Moraxella caviae]OOR86640.1 hypothetical protein B0181_11620 [Moraxella caviae]STZ14513.1 Uncharacterised protein [Moraxella caviae]VEW11307.1 Uncharacterised protein [Moraxella caviae]
MAKILYFTTDFGQKNRALAKEHGLTIRNASQYKGDDFIEQCDFVFGDVPKQYQHLPVFELQADGEEKQDVVELPKADEKPTRRKKA